MNRYIQAASMIVLSGFASSAAWGAGLYTATGAPAPALTSSQLAAQNAIYNNAMANQPVSLGLSGGGDLNYNGSANNMGSNGGFFASNPYGNSNSNSNYGNSNLSGYGSTSSNPSAGCAPLSDPKDNCVCSMGNLDGVSRASGSQVSTQDVTEQCNAAANNSYGNSSYMASYENCVNDLSSTLNLSVAMDVCNKDSSDPSKVQGCFQNAHSQHENLSPGQVSTACSDSSARSACASGICSGSAFQQGANSYALANNSGNTWRTSMDASSGGLYGGGAQNAGTSTW